MYDLSIQLSQKFKTDIKLRIFFQKFRIMRQFLKRCNTVVVLSSVGGVDEEAIGKNR